MQTNPKWSRVVSIYFWRRKGAFLLFGKNWPSLFPLCSVQEPLENMGLLSESPVVFLFSYIHFLYSHNWRLLAAKKWNCLLRLPTHAVKSTHRAEQHSGGWVENAFQAQRPGQAAFDVNINNWNQGKSILRLPLREPLEVLPNCKGGKMNCWYYFDI